MFKKIKSIYYNFITGINNLKKYFKVIWNDRDWDYQFLFIYLRQKLFFKQQYFLNSTISDSNKECAKEIQKCVEILDRLIEDNYCKEEKEVLNKKWGEINIIENKIIRENINTQEDENKYLEELSSLIDKEGLQKQQDLEELFQNLSNNIENWWD